MDYEILYNALVDAIVQNSTYIPDKHGNMESWVNVQYISEEMEVIESELILAEERNEERCI